MDINCSDCFWIKLKCKFVPIVGTQYLTMTFSSLYICGKLKKKIGVFCFIIETLNLPGRNHLVAYWKLLCPEDELLQQHPTWFFKFSLHFIVFCCDVLQFLNLPSENQLVVQLKHLASKVLFALSLNNFTAVFSRISARYFIELS